MKFRCCCQRVDVEMNEAFSVNVHGCTAVHAVQEEKCVFYVLKQFRFASM